MISGNYKVGKEFLPYHASASHTPPDFRDGWNACFSEAEIRITELEAQLTDLELKLLTERGAKAWKDVPDATAFVEELRGNTDKPDCVKLAISGSSVWAHFRVGNGYTFSLNLSADDMAELFVNEYIASVKEST